MGIYIEKESTFNAKLREGINLFTGAGFSVLAFNKDGQKMPIGSELLGEMKNEFSMQNSPLGLGKLCKLLKTSQSDKYYAFLRKRFSIGDYDSRYNILKSVNIKSIFTANIDDLLYKIFDESEERYLTDVSICGSNEDPFSLEYIPLHGSVAHADNDFVFAQDEIAIAHAQDIAKFGIIPLYMQKRATLFCGYSMNDASVDIAMHPYITKNRPEREKWILLTPEEYDDYKDYYRTIGFLVAKGTTEDLLDYFSSSKKTAIATTKSSLFSRNDSFWNKYLVRKSNKGVLRSITDFFSGAEPTWNDIFNPQVPRLHYYAEILDDIYSGKNIVITGIPMSGKTTILKQLASNYSTDIIKLYSKRLSQAEASLILRKLKGNNAIVFLDNVADSVEAYNELISNGKVQVVAADREYDYEVISHSIKKQKSKKISITELSEQDIQFIYSNLPPSIKKSPFTFPEMEPSTPPSIYEVVCENITEMRQVDRMIEMLKKASTEDKTTYELLLLGCYLYSCRTAISLDMIIAYLSGEVHISTLPKITKRLDGLLVDDAESSDSFSIRSSYLAKKVMDSMPIKDLAFVINKFYDKVSYWLIADYDTFKKRAFDKDIMKRIFPYYRDGIAFYEKVYEFQYSPYVLQQGALYLSSLRKHKLAFNWIDRALIGTNSRSLSIKNSHAIILFRANIDVEPDSLEKRNQLVKSMDILKSCYKLDARKIFHSLVFAEQACKFWDTYKDEQGEGYLRDAHHWIKAELSKNPQDSQLKWKLSDIRRRLPSVEV